MHGEYKVPGGKLVVVDLEVEDGRIAEFHLAGDFFLEPDTALDAIDAAVTGLPVESDAAAIAAAVRGALPDGAQLLGFTPESVGTAVRRALVTAPGWRDFEWEVVHERAVSPRMNLALDEVLTARVGDGRRRPSLRLWEWDESAVVIGSFQSYRNEVDPDGAARHGFDVVRRISGGGAMMMAAGQIITYSLYVPASLVAGMTFADSYAFLDDWVLQALRSLGIEATYQPLNDIASPTGKIGGRRAEAPGERRSAPPCDAQLRHRRAGDDRGAAHRPGEAQRQGHHLGGQARRPPPQPDRPAARADHRALHRDVHPLVRSRAGAYHRRGIRRGRGSRRGEVRDGRVAAPRAVSGPTAGRVWIHEGDNLEVIREFEDDSFTLVYLDPPFNTGRVQARQVESARSTADGPVGDGIVRRGFHGREYERLRGDLRTFDDRFDDYWAFLEPRLLEAWRLLAPDGTLYLHLDYREAHYAKVLLDAMFGRECFLNEIIWAYDFGAKTRRRWPTKHDTILVYVKDPERYWFDSEAVDREPYMAPGLVTPEKAERGKLPTDVWWHTIVPTTGREKTGYPTQKPEGILRRIIQASTRPGDRVLDFFAGSGTTGAVAAALGRDAVLVDDNPEAIAVMRARMPAGTETRVRAD